MAGDVLGRTRSACSWEREAGRKEDGDGLDIVLWLMHRLCRL